MSGRIGLLLAGALLLSSLPLTSGCKPDDADAESGGDGAGDGGAEGPACSPDGRYQGPWTLDVEEGPCDRFDPFDFAGGSLLWTVGQGGTRLEVQGYNYRGTLDAATCASEFVDRQPGATGTWTFAFADAPVAASFTLDRERTGGDRCVKRWVGQLARRADPLRPFPDSEPVGFGQPLNAWGRAIDPRIVIGEGGDGFATWQQTNTFDAIFDLVGRAFDGARGTFGPTVELDGSDAPVDHLAVAGTRSGAGVVAFVRPDTERDNADFKSAYATVYEPATGFGEATPIEKVEMVTPTGPLTGPAVFRDVGGIVVAAADTATGLQAVAAYTLLARVYVSRYHDGAWAATEPAGAQRDQMPDVLGAAVNAAGEALVTSSAVVPAPGDPSSSALQACLADVLVLDGGGQWSAAPLPLPVGVADLCMVSHAVVAALSDGRFLVVAATRTCGDAGCPDGGLRSPLTAWLFRDGHPEPAQDIGRMEAIYDRVDTLHVTADGEGGALVVWSDHQGGSQRHAFARFDGQTFAPAARFLANSDDDDALAMTPSGDAILVIGSENTVTPEEIEAAGRTGDPPPRRPAAQYVRFGRGAWSRPDVVLPERWGSTVAVGLDAAGAAVVLLLSQRPEQPQLTDVLVERIAP